MKTKTMIAQKPVKRLIFPTPGTIGRTVLVKCLSVDSDGFPVDKDGEPLGPHQKRIYFWEPRWRTEKWMKEHLTLWKGVPHE